MHNNHNYKLFIQCTQQKRSTVHGVTQEAKKACSLLLKTVCLNLPVALYFQILPEYFEISRETLQSSKYKNLSLLVRAQQRISFLGCNSKELQRNVITFLVDLSLLKTVKSDDTSGLEVSVFDTYSQNTQCVVLIIHLWCTDGVTFNNQTRKHCIGRNIENLLLKLKIAMFQRFCRQFLK